MSRARALEAAGARCERFSTFEPQLAKAREALPFEAPGAELVPASQALSVARLACAKATVERLLEWQEREGRQAASIEVQALTKAFGAERTLELLRGRWGPGADAFLPDVTASAFAVGATPEQPPPGIPDDPTPHRPAEPEPAELGAGADCLRRPVREAAACLGEWNRDGAPVGEFDAALARLVAAVERALPPLSDERRAELLGAVFAGLSLSSDRPALAPLVRTFLELAARVLPLAEQLRLADAPERGALLARPFLALDVTRRRAEPVCRAAARKHGELAREAGPRTLARAVHLSLAASFMNERVPFPRLEPGRWDVSRWDCPTSRPSLPSLPPGVTGRVVAFCRKTAQASHQTQSRDAAMRTFDYESTLEQLEVRADVTLTCGPLVTTRRLEARDVLLDLPTPDSRPGPLDQALSKLAREVASACASAAEANADAECRRLSGDALDVTQAFARHAQRLGAWPACFTASFRQRYGVPPPPVSDDAEPQSGQPNPKQLPP